VTDWFSKLFDRGASKKKSGNEWSREPPPGSDDRRPGRQGGQRSWPARDGADLTRPTVMLSSRAKTALPPGEDPHEATTRLVGPDDPLASDARHAADPAPTASQPADLPARAETISESAGRSPPETSPDMPADMTRLVAPAAGEGNDSVAGWLVVVKGPGLGRSLEIGAGANAIGRGPNQKISLNFGDPQISRERHAIVVYEPKGRRFFLQNGEVRNLTYIGDQVVLTPVELTGGETIALGQTQLKFVPFCGPQFGWGE
jgi:hypothetical protein